MPPQQWVLRRIFYVMEGLFLFAGLMLGELYQFGEKPVIFLGFVQKVGEGVKKREEAQLRKGPRKRQRRPGR